MVKVFLSVMAAISTQKLPFTHGEQTQPQIHMYSVSQNVICETTNMLMEAGQHAHNEVPEAAKPSGEV